MYKLLVALALVGFSSAELSCEDCSMIGTMLSADASSKEGIHSQVELIREPVCSQYPDRPTCEKELPQFWEYIATGLFNAEEGWFAPSNLCMDLCVKKTILKTPTCEDCANRLYGSVAYMADGDIQADAVESYVNSEFCSGLYPDNMEDCVAALELVIPTAMTTLAGSGDMWIADYCTENVGCSA